MKSLKCSSQLNLEKKNRDGLFLLVFRVYYNSQEMKLYTGIKCSEDKWDTKRRRVRHGSTVGVFSYNILNKRLNEQEDYINDYFAECAARNEEVDLKMLRSLFNGRFKTPASGGKNEFFVMYDAFLKEKEKTCRWNEQTVNIQKRLRNKIYEVKPTLTFSDLSEKVMNELVDGLSKTMHNDAIAKSLTYFRRFIKWVAAKGYVVNREFDTFEPKLKKCQKEIQYLTTSELKQIHDANLESSRRLSQVRDFFFFQCCTGLRDSDLRRLNVNDITEDKDGNFILSIKTKKDSGMIRFKLSDVAKEIYLKYKVYQCDDGLLFPIPSQQKYNDALKELGRAANLQGEWKNYQQKLNEEIVEVRKKQDLTSHIARRTFITTAYNAGVSLELIGKITSHSDLKCMKPYFATNIKGTTKVIDAIEKEWQSEVLK